MQLQSLRHPAAKVTALVRRADIDDARSNLHTGAIMVNYLFTSAAAAVQSSAGQLRWRHANNSPSLRGAVPDPLQAASRQDGPSHADQHHCQVCQTFSGLHMPLNFGMHESCHAN